MHGKRFKDFILRLVIASAHSYFVPAWGESMPTCKEVPVVPFAKADSPQFQPASGYRDIRARTANVDHWRDLLLPSGRVHRGARRAETPKSAPASVLDRYM